MADAVVIVDEQKRSMPAPPFTRFFDYRIAFGMFLAGGQEDSERRAVPGNGVHFQRPGMGAHDPGHKPRARARAR